jgi:hypothetical protein
MNALSPESRVCFPDALSITMAARDPLAVLLLSTDILREHGNRLSAGMLREQREVMHHAALQLSQAMRSASVED